MLFEESARSFLDLLTRVAPHQWDEPGLGTWTVRSLAGHTLRAITTVGEYLAIEPPPAPPASITCFRWDQWRMPPHSPLALPFVRETDGKPCSA